MFRLLLSSNYNGRYRLARNYIRPARYTTTLEPLEKCSEGIPIYRVVCENGALLDPKHEPKVSRISDQL